MDDKPSFPTTVSGIAFAVIMARLVKIALLEPTHPSNSASDSRSKSSRAVANLPNTSGGN